jgi:hypothetical protein
MLHSPTRTCRGRALRRIASALSLGAATCALAIAAWTSPALAAVGAPVGPQGSGETSVLGTVQNTAASAEATVAGASQSVATPAAPAAPATPSAASETAQGVARALTAARGADPRLQLPVRGRGRESARPGAASAQLDPAGALPAAAQRARAALATGASNPSAAGAAGQLAAAAQRTLGGAHRATPQRIASADGHRSGPRGPAHGGNAPALRGPAGGLGAREITPLRILDSLGEDLAAGASGVARVLGAIALPDTPSILSGAIARSPAIAPARPLPATTRAAPAAAAAGSWPARVAGRDASALAGDDAAFGGAPCRAGTPACAAPAALATSRRATERAPGPTGASAQRSRASRSRGAPPASTPPGGVTAPGGGVPSSAVGAGAGISIFLLLLGLLLVWAPRTARRLRPASESLRLAPHVLIPERPG